MTSALFFAALRGRYHLWVGALAIAAFARGAFALWGQGPWASSQQAFGLRAVSFALAAPAFAALLGGALAGQGEEAEAFLLARPVSRGAQWWIRIAADWVVLLGAAAILMGIAPLADSEALPLPVLPALALLWIGAHGLAAAGGSVGLASLSAAGGALLLTYGVAWMTFLVSFGSLEALAPGGDALAEARGARLMASLGAGLAAAVILGLLGWWVSRRAAATAPRIIAPEGWRLKAALVIGGACLASVVGALGFAGLAGWIG